MILMLFTLLWFGIANSQTTSNLYPDSVRCDGTNFTFYYPISQANSLNSVTELVLNVVGATTLDTLTVGNTTQNSTSYNIITNINGLSCCIGILIKKQQKKSKHIILIQQ